MKIRHVFIATFAAILLFTPVLAIRAALWESCTNWDFVSFNASFGQYHVRNNEWNASHPNAGNQCMWADSSASWGANATHTNGDGQVKGYPQIIRGWWQWGGWTQDNVLPARLNAITTADIRWKYSHNANRAWGLLDIWVHSATNATSYPKANIMIEPSIYDFTNWHWTSAHSGHTNHGEHTLGGVTWKIWQTTASWATGPVLILIPASAYGQNLRTADIQFSLKAILDWAVARNILSANDYLLGVHAGWEVVEGGTFTTQDYWTDIRTGTFNPPTNTPVAPTSTPVTTTPPPSGSTTNYEAESGTLTGGARIQSASNASNGQVIGNLNVTNDAVQISNVNGGSGGAASLVVRFSQGNTSNRSLSLYVNGTKVQQITFAPTGSWNTFANTAAISINLNAGTGNTIKIQKDASDANAADIDRFSVTVNGSTAPSPTPTSTATSAPVTGLLIYGDSTTWTAGGWQATWNLMNPLPAIGSRSIAVDISAWSGFSLTSPSAVSTSGYTKVTFYVNSTTNISNIALVANGNYSFKPMFNIKANEWTKITINLSQVGNPSTITELVWHDQSGGNPPVFYVDDVKLE
jgi:hypothetical protein